jgi:hypothetical protein
MVLVRTDGVLISYGRRDTRDEVKTQLKGCQLGTWKLG